MCLDWRAILSWAREILCRGLGNPEIGCRDGPGVKSPHNGSIGFLLMSAKRFLAGLYLQFIKGYTLLIRYAHSVGREGFSIRD
ncbi:hypothetical protein M404DRAFT_998181 [Pisolithus tinctorius Marx 270]|uniref:Uncharacterized protein n=1 Tax=Pisolithus tinctorius Marx 270 TaxID=870435 RepID=A0A0C3PGG4_PISTI|nr:hypothetical protein M404DRAFT_998181 [Pisolithus tinctorius Marx 270]